MDKAVDLIKVLPIDDIPLLQSIITQYLEETDNSIMMIHSTISPFLIDIFNVIHFDKIRIEVITDDKSGNRAVVIFNKEAMFEVRFIFDDNVADCAIIIPTACYNKKVLGNLRDTINLAEKLLIDFISYYESLDDFYIYDSDDSNIMEDLRDSWDAPRVLTTLCSNPNTTELIRIFKTISTYIIYDKNTYLSCFGREIIDDEDPLLPDIVYFLSYVKGNKQIIARVDTDFEFNFELLTIIALNKDNFTPLSYREAKELYNEVGNELKNITSFDRYNISKPTTLS